MSKFIEIHDENGLKILLNTDTIEQVFEFSGNNTAAIYLSEDSYIYSKETYAEIKRMIMRK